MRISKCFIRNLNRLQSFRSQVFLSSPESALNSFNRSKIPCLSQCRFLHRNSNEQHRSLHWSAASVARQKADPKPSSEEKSPDKGEVREVTKLTKFENTSLVVKERKRRPGEEEQEEKEYTEEDRKRDYRKKYTANAALISKTFFEDVKNKNRETFVEAIQMFTTRDRHLRGHVEFIYAALRHMKLFGVHRDLEAYKKLIDVFPKGKMVATTFWQVEFMHYPKQQNCAIDVLEQMEDFGVMGDSEMEDMLTTIFGRKSFPVRKLGRMMYWMPKFKHLSPWYLPDPLPDDTLELVKLAIQRITSVDLQTKITIYNAEDLEDAVDHTWIVSGQSPDQQALIESHPAERPIYVEGAFRVWLRDQCINYFILRSEPRPPPKVTKEYDPDDVGQLDHLFKDDLDESDIIPAPTVHEQDDGNILAVCATGTSSRDSLISWIRFLQDENPRLGRDISVLFTLKSPIGPTDNLDRIEQESGGQEKLAEKDKDAGLVDVGMGFNPMNPDLSQVGIWEFSESRFRNWPHDHNRGGVPEEEKPRISADVQRKRWLNSVTNKKSNESSVSSSNDGNNKDSS